MRRGLVGDDVDRARLLDEPRQQVGGVAEDADRERATLVAGGDRELEGVLERVGLASR